MKDRNEKIVKDGDIIDINQTVNGQNKFVILDVKKKDIRYEHDLNRKYEYDVDSLLAPDSFSGEVDFVIIGNIKQRTDLPLQYKIMIYSNK